MSLKRDIKRERFILSLKNSDYTSIGKNTLPKERHSKREQRLLKKGKHDAFVNSLEVDRDSPTHKMMPFPTGRVPML